MQRLVSSVTTAGSAFNASRGFASVASALKNPKLFQQKAYVDGKWVDSVTNKSFEVLDPSSGQPIGTVPDMNVEDTRNAIEAAHKAFPAWRSKTAKERSDILRKWFNLINDNKEDLARILVEENGKPIAEARGEIGYGNSFIEWFAEEGKRAYGEVIPQTVAGKRFVVIRQPVGVAALITPWNFPNAMITRKAAPALAAGCTVVVKPASETPYSALAIAQLAEEAGVPAGVLNIITTSREGTVKMGEELSTNSTVRKLSFTGSTPVGKLLMAQCAGTVKRVSLELGGNAPFIVFDDADVDAAVKGVMASKFRNSGQTCVCANRILVQDKIHDEFVEKFSKAVAALKVGRGTEPDVTIGPLINKAAVEKVSRYLDDAKTKGAKIVLGGSKLHGNYFEPTVLTGVSTDMLVSKEEIFGPLAPVYRFKTEEEAIAIANATTSGLAGYFFSRDIGRVWRVAEALEYGMIGINEGIFSTEAAPFGGIKESGIGREGSRHGLDEYTYLKYLCMGGIGN
eukprot:TRINITY_DN6538_c0_g1_i1.p1 TRINITY_DN6538_c0_g1~~TRINITY_DN6538_c0_g1_i1.p1  ORF type:complete len:512 (+),score=152.75 TRINITY_DN6538_c0_g1_i1:142-1677(+)